MNIIKPDTMPRLWWLNPWAAARYLHSAATALKDYADQADRCIEMQIRIIEDKNAELEAQRLKLLEAQQSRQHWIDKHDRAYAVAMHNERVIARLEDSIIAGRAIIPDAKPNE
jgi:RES domain-containing protein